MLTTRHPVDFAYTRPELEALFAYVRAHEATKEDSDILGTFYVRWGEAPVLWEIETEEGFSLEDLMAELGRLELEALGWVKHGDVPREG